MNLDSQKKICPMLILPSLLTSLSAGAAKQPHVLFVVIDDLGWDDVGFRSEVIKTPTIDSLAARGVLLDQYYVQDVCSPSRATFQTGRYAMHHTIVDWIPPASSYGLPLNETTMAEKMVSAGYEAHAVGKWHLGFYKWGMTPTFRGFSSFTGFYSGGEDYFKHTSSGAYDFRIDTSPNCGVGCSKVDTDDQGKYSTTVFSEAAVKVVQAHDAAKPLFLYLAYQGVHSPAEVPESYKVPYSETLKDEPQRMTFAGMLSCVDEGIKNVTEAMQAKGMLDDTLIVFTADNGGPTTTGDGVGARNWPLKGGKHSIWEGGVRATAFLSAPAWLLPASASGTVYPHLMHGADWLPTLGSVCGYDVSADTQLPWLPAPEQNASASATHTYYVKPQLPVDGVSQWATIIANTNAEPDASATGPGPRDGKGVVIGNSTNSCSWPKSDPRHAKYAKLSSEAQALGCGFGIRMGQFKLIRGYGGGPDTWYCKCNRTGAASGKFSCASFNSSATADRSESEGSAAATTIIGASGGAQCTIKNGTCAPGNDLKQVETASAADCCSACASMAGCKGWTLNDSKNNSKKQPTCYLKSAINKQFVDSICVSGVIGTGPFPKPTPGPSPKPTPAARECPNGYCLYDLSVDPFEHAEVSAQVVGKVPIHPDTVKAMATQMDQVLQTYAQYELDPTCGPVVYENNSIVGKAWAPWC